MNGASCEGPLTDEQWKQNGTRHCGQSGSLRRIQWGIYLKVLRGNTPKEWAASIRKERDNYKGLLKANKVDLSRAVKVDPNLFNPLAKTKGNPWEAISQDEQLLGEIWKDVERTHSDQALFRATEVRQSLQRILFNWCKQNNPSSQASESYRQGMNELVAVVYKAVAEGRYIGTLSADLRELYSADDVEADTFAYFRNLMDMGFLPLFAVVKEAPRKKIEESPIGVLPTVRDMEQPVSPQTVIQRRCEYIMCDLLKKHDAELHFWLDIKHKIAPQLFLLRWIRVLFCREFTLDQNLELWSAIFYDAYQNKAADSLPLVDYVAIAMIQHVRTGLLSVDQNGCMQLLMHYPHQNSVTPLIRKAESLRNPSSAPGSKPASPSGGAVRVPKLNPLSTSTTNSSANPLVSKSPPLASPLQAPSHTAVRTPPHVAAAAAAPAIAPTATQSRSRPTPSMASTARSSDDSATGRTSTHQQPIQDPLTALLLHPDPWKSMSEGLVQAGKVFSNLTAPLFDEPPVQHAPATKPPPSYGDHAKSLDSPSSYTRTPPRHHPSAVNTSHQPGRRIGVGSAVPEPLGTRSFSSPAAPPRRADTVGEGEWEDIDLVDSRDAGHADNAALVRQLRHVVSDLQRELSASAQKIKDLESEKHKNVSYQERIANLEKDLSLSRLAHTNPSGNDGGAEPGHVAGVTQESHDPESKLAELVARTASLTAENESLRAQCATSDVDNKLTDLEAHVARLALENETLEVQCKTTSRNAENELAALEARAASLAVEKKALEVQNATASQDATRALAELETRSSSLHIENGALKTECAELAGVRCKLEELVEQNTSLIAENGSLQAQCAQLPDMDAKLHALNSENMALKTQCAQLADVDTKVLNATVENQTLKAQCAQFADMDAKLRSLMTENELLKTQITEFTMTGNKLQNLEGENQALISENEALEAQCAESRDMRSTLEKMEAQSSSLKAENDALKAQCTKLVDLDAKLRSLTKENETLKAQSAESIDVRNKLETLEAQSSSLRAENEALKEHHCAQLVALDAKLLSLTTENAALTAQLARDDVETHYVERHAEIWSAGNGATKVGIDHTPPTASSTASVSDIPVHVSSTDVSAVALSKQLSAEADVVSQAAAPMEQSTLQTLFGSGVTPPHAMPAPALAQGQPADAVTAPTVTHGHPAFATGVAPANVFTAPALAKTASANSMADAKLDDAAFDDFFADF